MITTPAGHLKNTFDDATIDKDDIKLINNILSQKEYFTNHNLQYTNKLENQFQKYLGIDSVYAFSKSRHALAAILDALELEDNDEVILQAFTCVVVANSILNSALKPIFCDIELDTFGPSLNSIKKLVTNKTRVIITQHSYGIVCRDYEEILDFSKDNNITVIDDCAQAIGAKFKGRSLGYFSSAAFYSMQHSKVISSGDGGIAVTNQDKISRNLGKIQSGLTTADHVWAKNTLFCIKRIYMSNKSKLLGRLFYEYYTRTNRAGPINITQKEVDGIFIENYAKKMPQSLAKLAINQLNKIDKIHAKRLLNMRYYTEWAKQNNILFPIDNDKANSVFLYFPMILEKEELEQFNINFRSKIKIGRQNVFLIGGSTKRQPNKENLPNASIAIEKLIYLPCY